MNICKTFKPWGNFEQFSCNEKSTVKILNVGSSESLSLQLHNNRDEYWKILEGTGVINIGNKTYQAKEGDEFWIPKKTIHRIIGVTDTKVLEISFGEFDENDIVRYDDIYGRKDKKYGDKNGDKNR